MGSLPETWLDRALPAERLIDTKLLGSLTTPAFQERAVAWCLDRGLLRSHAERVGHRLDAARVRVVRLAQDAGCRFAAPLHPDAAELCQRPGLALLAIVCDGA